MFGSAWAFLRDQWALGQLSRMKRKATDQPAYLQPFPGPLQADFMGGQWRGPQVVTNSARGADPSQKHHGMSEKDVG